MTSITIIIIIITSIVSFRAFQNYDLRNKFLFNAYQVAHRKEFWRMFSNGLIHANWSHLILNMFVLYMFGDAVEYAFSYYFEFKGVFYYLILYVGALFISSIPALRKHANNPSYNSLGASGATSAVLFSAIVIYPTQWMLFPPVPFFLFGIIYLFYEHYMGKRGGTGIAHDAHFAGAIYGVAFTLFIRPDFGMEFISQITKMFGNGF